VRKGPELVRKVRKWELNPFVRRFQDEDDVFRGEEDPSHLRDRRERSARQDERARELKRKESGSEEKGRLAELTLCTLPLDVLNTHPPPEQIIIRQRLPILGDLNCHS